MDGNAEGMGDGTNQKPTEGNGTEEDNLKTHGKGREQAGMSREGRRTMEKVLENTVRDSGQIHNFFFFFFFSSPYFAALGAYISNYIRWPVPDGLCLICKF